MRGAVSRVSPLARGAGQRLRRARSRVSALRQARRLPNNAEGSVACQEQAQLHIADGTLVMGTMSYYAPHVVTYPGVTGRVIVGNFASVAADADFHLGGLRRTERVSQHPLRAELGLPGAEADDLMYGDGDIVVGGDTWVTTGCAVMSGVTIGDGAVVGTKAVVAQDVRPYAIVVGNPAREVGRRFGDEQIDALLRIRWWDWPVDDVKRHVALLCSPDVDAFIARFDDRAAGG